MKDLVSIIIGALVVGGVFLFLWWRGYLDRLADYIATTREELRKCTWPTTEELKGSTVVVVISLILLGAFTVATDFIVMTVLSQILKAAT